MKSYRIILASKSPRRRELLAEMGYDFEIRTKDGIDETYPDGLNPQQTATFIANKKRDAFLPDLKDDELLITADTIVCLGNLVLGKPKNEEAARDMLKILSGKTHVVVTGVTVTTGDGMHKSEFCVTTEVRFTPLSDKVIEHYVSHYKPLDKAGAYGIQEWIGTVGIDGINGSYNNVVGLPTSQLKMILDKICVN